MYNNCRILSAKDIIEWKRVYSSAVLFINITIAPHSQWRSLHMALIALHRPRGQLALLLTAIHVSWHSPTYPAPGDRQIATHKLYSATQP